MMRSAPGVASGYLKDGRVLAANSIVAEGDLLNSAVPSPAVPSLTRKYAFGRALAQI
jgi:hypothetical protein